MWKGWTCRIAAGRTGTTQDWASRSKCCRIPWVELDSRPAECEIFIPNVRVPTFTARRETTSPTRRSRWQETLPAPDSELTPFAILKPNYKITISQAQALAWDFCSLTELNEPGPERTTPYQ